MGLSLSRLMVLGAMLWAIGGATLAQTETSPKLDSVVMVEKGYTMDVVSQSMRYDYAQWTLFRDGTAYSSIPNVAIPDFDSAASRRREPTRWGRWRRTGDALEVTWGVSANWKAYKSWFRLTPIPEGTRINAMYTVLNSVSQTGAFSSASFSGAKELTFRADGTFEQKVSGSSSYSGGTASVLSANSTLRRGTYAVRSDVLEFRFEDGKTTRATALLSAKDGATLFLNGSRLRRSKKL